MAGKFLLDTNIVIDFFSHSSPQVETLFDDAESLSISVTVAGELYYGAEKSTKKSQNVKRIEDLFNALTVLELDQQTAEIYGRLKSHLKVVGRPIPENDIWIAASAIRYDLTLATRDQHFLELPGLNLWSP